MSPCWMQTGSAGSRIGALPARIPTKTLPWFSGKARHPFLIELGCAAFQTVAPVTRFFAGALWLRCSGHRKEVCPCVTLGDIAAPNVHHDADRLALHRVLWAIAAPMWARALAMCRSDDGKSAICRNRAATPLAQRRTTDRSRRPSAGAVSCASSSVFWKRWSSVPCRSPANSRAGAAALHAERIFDALTHGELPGGKAGIVLDSQRPALDDPELTVRHVDLKAWMSSSTPAIGRGFVDGIERAVHRR